MENKSIAVQYCINIPEDATNSQTFINVFGVDVWKQMIEFSNLNEQFREFWEAPYKPESKDKGVLEQLAEKQNNLLAINKAWSDAIEKNGYVN